MNKNIQKLDKLLRVWIAAISVLAAASDVGASSVVDSLPELDRRTLLRGIRKLKSLGKLPSKYVVNHEKIQDKERVQYEFDYADYAVDLTWDDSADSMFYGQDDFTVSEEKQDDLVLKALSYYPDQLVDTSHLSDMIADTCEEADSLIANEIPGSMPRGISEEELELNYRDVEAMQNLEDQAEYDDIQDTAPSIGQEVAQISDLEVGNVSFVTSADENEQGSMSIVSDAYNLDEVANAELEAASDAIGNNAINQQADHTDLANTDTARVEIASHAINHNIDALSSNISKRFEVAGMAAVAAGDDYTEASGTGKNTGFYISPIIGKATQKENSSVSGYHSNSRGITIGFDNYVQDNMLLGMSYTKADDHVKFSNNKLSDRSKVTSDFYSIYGQLEPYNKNIFISGIGIYGVSNIKSSAQRGLDSIAISSHKAYSNIIQGTVGTQYKLSERLKIMPQLGIKYSKIRDAAYDEVSAGRAKEEYNLSVARTKERIIEAMAGFKMNYDHQLSNSISITPMIYGFVHKNIATKMPVIRSWMQRATNNEVLPDISISRSRVNFSYGAGFSVNSKNIEMGIFYNGSKARRYISHAGSMKLKINI
ncbi:MAG: autotransporter outer membrane beta-barrel domain-containing protein [Rickettsia endosymbiont of Glossina mortisans submortisans]|nr:autotransporter outer membrane beta-barrel domain-containing protein [Rickettsia endosymbiont of Glossina mortisans submortisans]